MGNKFISPENMGIEISKLVEEYTTEVSEAIGKEIDKTAKLVLKDIRATAPQKTGKYAKGFTIKKEDTLGSVSRIIYNKSKPGLVHLLELGHGMRGGGRVSAKPHLRPSYDKNASQLENNIVNIIKKGGK